MVLLHAQALVRHHDKDLVVKHVGGLFKTLYT